MHEHRRHWTADKTAWVMPLTCEWNHVRGRDHPRDWRAHVWMGLPRGAVGLWVVELASDAEPTEATLHEVNAVHLACGRERNTVTAWRLVGRECGKRGVFQWRSMTADSLGRMGYPKLLSCGGRRPTG